MRRQPLGPSDFRPEPGRPRSLFLDNYITVTQDGSVSWPEIESDIRAVILEKAKDHNPDFKIPEPTKAAVTAPSSPDLEKINAILDQTIRPALQMDGGDVQVFNYKDKQLEVFYEGACGSCPSATMGTLFAIQSILRDQFDPEINVVLADPY